MSDQAVERSASERALCFGEVADSYERGRPSFPRAAAAWLTGERPVRVLEVGAGTGKLTRELLALGHQVHATDPDPAMLELLERHAPGATVGLGSAEAIDAAPHTYDVVVAAQCLHWFDLDRALPEMARVLRPGGRLAAVWNERDERVPWVKRLGRLIGTQEQSNDPTEVLLASELFVDVEAEEFKFRQSVDRHTIQDLALSRSNIATLGEVARARCLSEVLALYDEYGRGMDGMAIPYFTRCFRGRVVEVEITEDDWDEESGSGADDAASANPGHDPMHDTMPRGMRGRVRPARPTGAADGQSERDDDMLLIDFH